MGRGSSKAGGGGAGNAVNKNLEEALNLAMSGGLNTSYDDVVDIQATRYGINAGNLSNADRTTLSNIITNSTLSAGQLSSNNLGIAQSIADGKVGNVSLSDFTSDELKTFIRIVAKTGTTSAQLAVNDALKLLSFYNQ